MNDDKMVTYRDPLSALAMFDSPYDTDTFREFCDTLRQDVESGNFDPDLKDAFDALLEEEKTTVIKMTATGMLHLYERSQFAFLPVFVDSGEDVEAGKDEPAPVATAEIRLPEHLANERTSRKVED